jgi:hypothetical protein
MPHENYFNRQTMIPKFRLLLVFITLLTGFLPVNAQTIKKFPFDPLVILKSWNYDDLIKKMGEGEEIMNTMKNQQYLAGLKYPFDLLGKKGSLAFYFKKDSISQFQFRQQHAVRVTSANLADKKIRDPGLNMENNLAMQKLDSVQRMDSLSRDSVVRAISEILGPPLSIGATDATEKDARFSALWINFGYSCLYKDFIDYSETVFSISTVPIWMTGEFDVPASTEILKKSVVKTMKMTWTASILGVPYAGKGLTYTDIFLFFEFITGQKYLVSLPKNAIDYLSRPYLMEFGTGQRFYLTIPENSIGYVPTVTFEDCDGDAIPEAWIQVPIVAGGSQVRHYIYSLKYKEPNLIFNSDEQIPLAISIAINSRVTVTLPDGALRTVEIPRQTGIVPQAAKLIPKGYNYLNNSPRNTDGTTNFTGGIEFQVSSKGITNPILEIIYKHIPNGWEIDQIKVLTNIQ